MLPLNFLYNSELMQPDPTGQIPFIPARQRRVPWMKIYVTRESYSSKWARSRDRRDGRWIEISPFHPLVLSTNQPRTRDECNLSRAARRGKESRVTSQFGAGQGAFPTCWVDFSVELCLGSTCGALVPLANLRNKPLIHQVERTAPIRCQNAADCCNHEDGCHLSTHLVSLFCTS